MDPFTAAAGSLAANVRTQGDELHSQHARLTAGEAVVTQLQGSLETSKARVQTLQMQLRAVQEQVQRLQATVDSFVEQK